MTLPAEKQLAGFIAKFEQPMQRLIRAARKRMRARLSGASELVYDNYNFLVIGYAPGERASEAIFSLAAQAKGLTLFFLQGASVPDPRGLLRGAGKVVRSIRLETVEVLDTPEVRTLMDAALARARVPISQASKHRLMIRAVSAKQRPRRAANRR
jgi:hypothetical protein